MKNKAGAWIGIVLFLAFVAYLNFVNNPKKKDAPSFKIEQLEFYENSSTVQFRWTYKIPKSVDVLLSIGPDSLHQQVIFDATIQGAGDIHQNVNFVFGDERTFVVCVKDKKTQEILVSQKLTRKFIHKDDKNPIVIFSKESHHSE